MQDFTEIVTYPNYHQHLVKFLDNYTIDFVHLLPERAHTIKLKPRNERICRYCNRAVPEVTFKKTAHVIPSLLGNRYLICDYECDDCNSLFSRFESSFAAYIGLMRTVTSLSRGNRVPKHNVSKSPVKTDTIKLIEQNKNAVCFTFKDEPEKIDKGLIIPFQKEPYTPIHVYKILLKMALSLMPHEYVEKYRHLMRFIINDENSKLFKPFATQVHVLNHNCIADPHFYLFKKLRHEDDFPTHIFMCCYEDSIYQFPVPANIDDERIYQDGKQINLSFCPPIFFTPPISNGATSGGIKDFSSYEVVEELGKLILHTNFDDTLNEQNPLKNTEVDEYLRFTNGSKLIITKGAKKE